MIAGGLKRGRDKITCGTAVGNRRGTASRFRGDVTDRGVVVYRNRWAVPDQLHGGRNCGWKSAGGSQPISGRCCGQRGGRLSKSVGSPRPGTRRAVLRLEIAGDSQPISGRCCGPPGGSSSKSVGSPRSATRRAKLRLEIGGGQPADFGEMLRTAGWTFIEIGRQSPTSYTAGETAVGNRRGRAGWSFYRNR
ncbi:MAG: hypothetical protein JWO19_3069 [Bryobacterales bacterium]|nr:hypothetical protein [Bryobacterales bacterium]